jgi:hypothetical protein
MTTSRAGDDLCREAVLEMRSIEDYFCRAISVGIFSKSRPVTTL